MNVNGKRLFVFDMDGTLLSGTTGLLELAKVLGTVDELHALEKRFSAGVLDTVGFTRQISSLWGRISDEVANVAFENSPKLEGINDVVQQVRELGGTTCIVTMSQDVFANGFKDCNCPATPPPLEICMGQFGLRFRVS